VEWVERYDAYGAVLSVDRLETERLGLLTA